MPKNEKDINSNDSTPESDVHNPYNEIKKIREILKKEARYRQEIAIKESGRKGKTDPLVHCENCDGRIDWIYMTCRNCGQWYCEYCWGKMDMEKPGKCPHCGGVPTH